MSLEDRAPGCMEACAQVVSSNRTEPTEVALYFITASLWFMLLYRLFIIFAPHYQSHNLVLNAPCENAIALECPRADIACARISLTR